MKGLAAALTIVAVATTAARAAHAHGKKETSPTTAAERTARDRVLAKAVGKKPPEIISLLNAHTREWLVIDADEHATIQQPTLNGFLRCYWDNAPTTMDRRLVGVLAKAALHFKADRVIIISGFRSRKFNLMLRKKGHEVARESQHSEGHAVDFRLPDVATATLRDYVKSLHLGGVGFYPESGFVHADTGKVRFWTGR